MRADEFITEAIDISSIKKLLRPVLKKYNLHKSDFHGGYCAYVAVGLWDAMGQPKELAPTSVIFGEEEHVVLMNRKEQIVIDPTGNQFDLPLYSANGYSRYRSPEKLSRKEIQSARDEGDAIPKANKPMSYWDKIDAGLIADPVTGRKRKKK